MNPCQILLENQELRNGLIVIGVIGYAIIECWLGKTDKVKAGSLLEAAYNIMVKEKKQEFEFPTPPKEEEKKDA